MNTQQLLNMSLQDVSKMTDKELRQATSILRSTGRKRYERLIEQDIYSPAVESMLKSAKGCTSIFPTVKGMDRSQLLNEFRRQKQFIEFKTSSVSGAKKVKAEMSERKTIINFETGKTQSMDILQRYIKLAKGGV